ncbi:hypothetical protein BSQ39_09680 [Loigolactobacillus backii]|uniref:hypothetical protein n=1 Tax=Loigolactobacillus backii TaxID=375175 RepID=UPI000C1CB5E7|nr:hypothetical protein [Loigolactobacillus backii]PIO83818.1 hypothetical protein BSQ39_09680 [Loigolactobacillus backii]
MTNTGKFSVIYGLTIICVGLAAMGLQTEVSKIYLPLCVFFASCTLGFGGLSFYLRPRQGTKKTQSLLKWYLIIINCVLPWLLVALVQVRALMLSLPAENSTTLGIVMWLLRPFDPIGSIFFCIIVQGFTFTLLYPIIWAPKIRRTWLVLFSVIGILLLSMGLMAIVGSPNGALEISVLTTFISLIVSCFIMPIMSVVLLIKGPAPATKQAKQNKLKKLIRTCRRALAGLQKAYPKGSSTRADNLMAAITTTMKAAQRGSVAGIDFDWFSLVRMFVDETTISSAAYFTAIDEMIDQVKRLQDGDYKITIPHFYCLQYTEGNRVMTIDIDFRDPQLSFDSSMINHWQAPYDHIVLSQRDKNRIYKNIRQELILMVPEKTKRLAKADKTMSIREAKRIIKKKKLDATGFFQSTGVIRTPAIKREPAGYAVFTVGDSSVRHYLSKSRALKAYINRLRIYKQAEYGQIVGLNVRLIKELGRIKMALKLAKYRKEAEQITQILVVLRDATASRNENIAALESFIMMANVRYLGDMQIPDYDEPYSWMNRVTGAKHFAEELVLLLKK